MPKIEFKFCTNVGDLLHINFTQVGGGTFWMFQIYKCVVCLTMETKCVATSKSCREASNLLDLLGN